MNEHTIQPGAHTGDSGGDLIDMCVAELDMLACQHIQLRLDHRPRSGRNETPGG
ncbi:MAG TPA: hypothetical protein VEI53_03700 [Ktedonobacteraceae bacterium]|nr:hypothetical protein [Ktedonobacteraceae bacterium]